MKKKVEGYIMLVAAERRSRTAIRKLGIVDGRESEWQGREDDGKELHEGEQNRSSFARAEEGRGRIR